MLAYRKYDRVVFFEEFAIREGESLLELDEIEDKLGVRAGDGPPASN